MPAAAAGTAARPGRARPAARRDRSPSRSPNPRGWAAGVEGQVQQARGGPCHQARPPRARSRLTSARRSYSRARVSAPAPSTRKNRVIRPSLTQCRRSLASSPPPPGPTGSSSRAPHSCPATANSPMPARSRSRPAAAPSCATSMRKKRMSGRVGMQTAPRSTGSEGRVLTCGSQSTASNVADQASRRTASSITATAVGRHGEEAGRYPAGSGPAPRPTPFLPLRTGAQWGELGTATLPTNATRCAQVRGR